MALIRKVDEHSTLNIAGFDINVTQVLSDEKIKVQYEAPGMIYEWVVTRGSKITINDVLGLEETISLQIALTPTTTGVRLMIEAPESIKVKHGRKNKA